MREYLASLAGPDYVDAILWTFAALVLLALVLGVVKAVGTMNSGTFVAGGRARKTRLAVMDATAVDSQRRLVLVRRDDVEHLLLIGGPNDIVVEQDIRVAGQARRPAQAETPRPAAAEEEEVAPRAPEPPPAPRPIPQSTVSRPHQPPQSAIERAPRPAPEPPRPAAAERPSAPPRPIVPHQRPAPAPIQRSAPPLSAPAARTAADAAASNQRKTDEELDAELLSELNLSSDEISPPAPKPQKPSSLDDEMARLLGELAGTKR